MTIELIFNLLVGLGIVFYVFQAFTIPQTDNPTDILGAGGFPIILGILGLIVLGIITVNLLKKGEKVRVPLFHLKSADGRCLAINVAFLCAYMFLINFIGFITSTFFYLLLAGWSIGFRKGGKLAIYAVAVTAALTVVFGVLFLVPLPRGVGYFRELSYMIY